MASLELSGSPGALLLAAWLYFLGGGAALAAAFTAALAHELGHLTALSLYGAELRGLRLTAAGPVLDYAGALSPGREAVAVGAGPLGGVLFAALCFGLDTPYFRYAGLVSLLCSIFNLLPALPMDGGRLARLFLETTLPETAVLWCMRGLGVLTGLALIGLAVAWRAPVIGAAGISIIANAVNLR